MKKIKLFKLQASSFLSQVLFFHGKGSEYKMMGVVSWISILITIAYFISIMILIY
jgi:hypothetical protein